MSTLDIVGIYLEHRLCVHASRLGSTKVLIGLLAACFLCFLANKHTTGKGSNSMVIENILIKFVTCAVRNLMIDERIIVNVLLFVGNHTTIAMTFGAFSFENKVKAIARYSIV